MYAVQVQNLTKKYGDVTALNNLSLSVKQGELFGLLGVNGAGKTTLIKILCGLLLKDQGLASVCNLSVDKNLADIKKLIAVSPQETSVAPNLTVYENLLFFAQIYYKNKIEAKERANKIINDFNLQQVLNKRAKTLSGGWQRRLSVAISLISNPQVLFLDEPTLGLDILARRELWKIINNIKGKITIILTSHYLEEIEALCDRVAILSKGNLLAVDTVQELMKKTGESTFENAFVKIAEGGEAL
ncbi:MAG: ABC transporter ATP-binding protein [Clostridia bacterium]|nr:ABC transporter ATP-binding protein [Clostridia bacterium]